MRPQHRLIELPERGDARGLLTFGQENDHIPFSIKRFFALYNVAEGAQRGGHAHHKQHQFLVMLAGSASIVVDNGGDRHDVRLDRPNLGLHVPPMLWLELGDFTKDAVCLALASGPYDESDYIRDRDSF